MDAEFRHDALTTIFESKPMPGWGNVELLNSINFDDIYYYLKPTEEQGETWDDVPEYIKNTFEKLGIPEAERKFLAGVSAQYESEVVYHSLQKEIEEQGVIFSDMDTGLREHEELVRKYFATMIPPEDNKFAALNSAVWSGGSFVYVPPGVEVTIPLQAYFRINSENMGQFERTLIIADEGSRVHYIEGLHGADLCGRFAALGGGRAGGAAGRAPALHDHPELVQERLQPGDQARRRPRECHGGVGRWQPRLQAHDEVPVRLPGG